MTLALPSVPLVALTTPVSTSAPPVVLKTPPAASSVVPVSPPAAQLVPHVLPTSAVSVSPMVHPHLMRTHGAVGF
jgi:hypothetical protein